MVIRDFNSSNCLVSKSSESCRCAAVDGKAVALAKLGLSDGVSGRGVDGVLAREVGEEFSSSWMMQEEREKQVCSSSVVRAASFWTSSEKRVSKR